MYNFLFYFLIFVLIYNLKSPFINVYISDVLTERQRPA